MASAREQTDEHCHAVVARQAPKRTSGTEMVRALRRVVSLAAFELGG
ncbi:hypothetical protein GCM10018965_009860 [Nonomuraea roseola]